MKKILKNGLPFILVTMLVSGCSYYSSDPAKKSEIVGTYALETYEKHNEDGEIYNYKNEINAQAYFVIKDDGYGCYFYKDNETPLKYAQTYSKFVEADDVGKYKAISMTDGISNISSWSKKVGCMDEPTMGFQKDLFKKTLSYTIPDHTYTIYDPPKVQHYQHVVYKKISDDTTLDTINSKLGTNISITKPFELQNCSGYYAYTRQMNDLSGFWVSYADETYEYMILDMSDCDETGVTLYYSIIGSGTMESKKVPVEIVSGNGYFNSAKLNVFGKEYICNNNGDILGSALYRDYSNDLDNSYYQENFSHYYGTGETIQEIIANLGK